MSTRRIPGVFTVLALAALPVLSLAQQPMQLTALDYIEIQQLVAKYARAIDTCSNNGYDYADLYTEDGIFQPDMGGGRAIPPFQGRERLAQASGGGAQGCNAPWIAQGVRHIYTNHIITATPEGASGTVDMLMIGLDGDPQKIAHDGYYDDVYVKTAQGWRFKQRTHHALLNAGQPIERSAGAATPATPATPAGGAAPSVRDR
jgi:hypothetical protein